MSVCLPVSAELCPSVCRKGAGLHILHMQVAIRNNQQGVFYFNDQIPLTALMQEDGRIEPAAFVQTWKNLPTANETQKELPISITSLDSIKSRIEAANIFLMAHKQVKLCKLA